MAHLLLYDGVCGLCQGVVQFVLERDHHARFCFAALQSALAEDILRSHGVTRVELSTFYVVVDHGSPAARLLDRSDGGLFVLGQLGGVLSPARWLTVVPRTLRNRVYEVVARNRYAWFGTRDHCVVPSQQTRSRFLDITDGGV